MNTLIFILLVAATFIGGIMLIFLILNIHFSKVFKKAQTEYFELKTHLQNENAIEIFYNAMDELKYFYEELKTRNFFEIKYTVLKEFKVRIHKVRARWEENGKGYQQVIAKRKEIVRKYANIIASNHPFESSKNIIISLQRIVKNLHNSDYDLIICKLHMLAVLDHARLVTLFNGLTNEDIKNDVLKYKVKIEDLLNENEDNVDYKSVTAYLNYLRTFLAGHNIDFSLTKESEV